MRVPSVFVSLAVAPFLVGFPASLLPPASPVLAGDSVKAGEPSCTCPDARASTKPRFADLHDLFDESDEIAALEAVQIGLARTADGATYVWRRRGMKRLGGVVAPTTSFRNAAGTICRHVVVLLTSGTKTRTREGIACRGDKGRWLLEG